jgi:hypothetical protein
LIVFPEGTRSKSNHIQRFHKGAFYLAEYFNLDIIPVVIHGNSEALPKGDFIIYDGSITVNILERITPDNKAFGENYTERTKKVSAYFKNQFNQMREALEDVDYFRKTLVNSFDYKEPEVVAAVKKDIAEKMSCYYELNKHIQKRQVYCALPTTTDNGMLCSPYSNHSAKYRALSPTGKACGGQNELYSTQTPHRIPRRNQLGCEIRHLTDNRCR